MLGNFSEEAQEVLLMSKNEMIDLNHPYIGTEHMILSILKTNGEIAKKLETYGLTYDAFKNEILKVVGRGTKKSQFFLYTPLLKKVIENALLDAKDNNHGEVLPTHLLSSLLEEGEGIAIRIMIGMNIKIDNLYDEFSSKLIKKSNKRKRKLMVESLGVDLVSVAKNKPFDPVIGRDNEINRLIEILCRRTKNNPILIGEAGVGKTAIVEGLASMIASNKVPRILQGQKIISLDMASLVAGTKYRGEFEERMQKIIKEVSEEEDIILFIDEIHTLVGAGGADGAIDASNILKPALARGEIRCIGATTTYEYKKYIEQDKALARRFQPLIVEETSVADTVEILRALRPIYEEYHRVEISDEILLKIVSLTEEYIYDRYHPDKDIDILDEVCSMVSIRESKQEKSISNIKGKLDLIRKNKNSLILDNDIKSAYDCLKKETKLNKKLLDLEKNLKVLNKKITLDDIASVVYKKTAIPIYEINKSSNNLNMLKKNLKDFIIGQDKAIECLCNDAKKLSLGYSNHKIKSYLFVGPTGVGKTKLAKLYAKYLVGESNFIRLDMSEYSDKTAINKIIGSAPGYVGYGDYNNVFDQIKSKPNAVILLDEIDKASSEVINLLYQILDEGKLTNSKNTTLNLKHNVIIMTSNLGFLDNVLGFEKEKGEIINSLKESIPLPLINRVDNIISFDYLKESDMREIVKKKLDELVIKYPSFSYTTNVVDEIISRTDYQEFGARKVDKIIDAVLENEIIDRLVQNEEAKIISLDCSLNKIS